jgi:hypothetical protein
MYHSSIIAGEALSEGSVAHKLVLDLVGPLSLRDGAGKDLTPKARKAQGLLALIGAAKRLRRSRAWLQDKLWSDRGPEQGAASLRQCLHCVRVGLGAHVDCLKAEAGWIGLDPDRVLVRTEGGGDAEFLEGLDVPDPEFEHWLRDQRMAHADRSARFAADDELDDRRSVGWAPAKEVGWAPARDSAHRGQSSRAVRSPAGRSSAYAFEATAEEDDFIFDRMKRSLLDCAVDLAEFYASEHAAVVALAQSAVHVAFHQKQATRCSGQGEPGEAAQLALKALHRLFLLHGIHVDSIGRVLW